MFLEYIVGEIREIWEVEPKAGSIEKIEIGKCGRKHGRLAATEIVVNKIQRFE
jgi:hypothetical protein